MFRPKCGNGGKGKWSHHRRMELYLQLIDLALPWEGQGYLNPLPFFFPRCSPSHDKRIQDVFDNIGEILWVTFLWESSPSFIARQKKWKEELDEELEMRRGKFSNYVHFVLGVAIAKQQQESQKSDKPILQRVWAMLLGIGPALKAVASMSRSMLQTGIDLSTVDVSYVSSRSWYFLNLFGLRGLFSLILGEENAMDDTQRMMQMGGFGMDPTRV
ncbi:hypothetical protein Nepgr_021961 [Nepenthes gracilis]|uniref:ER membrane protein complex subunit 3 n=1 Tax=Nepenthes gracilis TaxID=150966 RepID=A0AAD3SYI1_NEPGR|nr:hypothetical protein Nepgr_021961 [Nepenthes gracilis]